MRDLINFFNYKVIEENVNKLISKIDFCENTSSKIGNKSNESKSKLIENNTILDKQSNSKSIKDCKSNE